MTRPVSIAGDRRDWLRAAAGLPLLARARAPGAAQPVTFALIGDVPYGDDEEAFHRQVLAQLDPDCQFAIHVGDLKGGAESCDDALLARRHRLLDTGSALPLVFVPGDNDWFDCSRPSNGRFDPLERLRHLRRLFFAAPRTLGPRAFTVQRQSDLDPRHPFDEHLRWRIADVHFVTVNLPGGIDWRALGGATRAGLEALLVAGERWLRDAFAWASGRTLVIAAHADPKFGADESRARPHDPLPGFRALLRELCGGFPGHVLFAHGDTHVFRNDQPLRLPDGTRVANLTRVEAFGSPFASSWVHVRVTPGSEDPFFVNIRQLPTAAALAR